MSESAHSLPDDDRVPSHAGPDPDQPDWLVSSDQGAEDERQTSAPGERPVLVRLDTSPDLSSAVPVERPKLPERREAAAPQEAERSTGPKPWTGAASSVPRVKVDVTARDSEERKPGAVAASPARANRPAPDRSAVPPGWEDDRGFADGEDADAFPDDTGPLAPVTPMAAKQLNEPFWVVALETLRGNPKILLGVLVAILIPVLAWTFWPRAEPGVSLRALRQDPARWDGQTVRINGRVGDVFSVGVGWAYNLHQGRDTIVVFTRGAAPHSHDKISVAGSVSTGYLDGQPRQAIFAEP